MAEIEKFIADLEKLSAQERIYVRGVLDGILTKENVGS